MNYVHRKNLYEYLPDLQSSKESEKNPQWKGDNVGYICLHAWVRRRLIKPAACPLCGLEKKLDLANISNEYKRDLSDWEWLCRKCHMNKDGRIKNLFRKKAFLPDVHCICGKIFHPRGVTTQFCSRKCKCDNVFFKTLSRFTISEIKEMKYKLTYAQIYTKYKITQGVISKIKALITL